MRRWRVSRRSSTEIRGGPDASTSSDSGPILCLRNPYDLFSVRFPSVIAVQAAVRLHFGIVAPFNFVYNTVADIIFIIEGLYQPVRPWAAPGRRGASKSGELWSENHPNAQLPERPDPVRYRRPRGNRQPSSSQSASRRISYWGGVNRGSAWSSRIFVTCFKPIPATSYLPCSSLKARAWSSASQIAARWFAD